MDLLENSGRQIGKGSIWTIITIKQTDENKRLRQPKGLKMKVEISNKIRLYNPPDLIKQRWVRRLVIKNPEYQQAVMVGRSTWDIEEFIYNFSTTPDGGLLIPRGVRKQMLDELKDENITFELIDKRTLFPYVEVNIDTINYRSYQFDSVMNLVKVPEGILVSPAGSGKTVVGLSLIPVTGQKTLWITHTGPLAKQAMRRAKEFIPDIGDIGYIGGGKWTQGDVLTVAMVQTLVRNLDRVVKMKNDYGLVVIDECHHTPSTTFTKVVNQLSPFFLYGLTATPYRRDKLEILMFQVIGQEKTIISVEDVGSQMTIPQILVKRIFHNRINPDADLDIQTILKHYIIENKERNRLIITDVISEAEKGHHCLVISDRKSHCEQLYKTIKMRWAKTDIVTGDYKKSEIEDRLKAVMDEDITVLVATFSLLGEGTDLPILDRAFIAMPFRSEAKAEQLIGRLQRSHPGKKGAIVHDYLDINIGFLENQFSHNDPIKECRVKAYKRVGAEILIK
jgi:superfamily II DNA or RNA helicase